MIDWGKCILCRIDLSDADGYYLQIEMFGLVFNVSIGR